MSDQDSRLDVQQVMNLVVDKMCNNIRYWHDGSNEILEQTLEVFVELVSSYSSSKTLLGLETVNFLVHNHVGSNFPFLGYDRDNKHRITFYSALSRLVFSSSEDMDNMFDRFVAPNLEIMAQLSASPDINGMNMKVAIIGALRDLRGITTSAYNKRTYNLLFDALYPSSFPLLNRIAQTWYADADVMTALLKFMQEFVSNKGQRIYFDQSSANGILLFRETSNILCAYGSRILEVPVVSDIYIEKYKGIRLMLNTLTAALTGNYVNFGIFSLYQDPALQNALDIALQMCLNIPLADVMTHVKLSKAFYGCLEVLFRNHLDVLCGLDSKVFLQLVNANHEGLQSVGECLGSAAFCSALLCSARPSRVLLTTLELLLTLPPPSPLSPLPLLLPSPCPAPPHPADPQVTGLCASTVDHLASFLFLNQNRSKPTVERIRSHMTSEPGVVSQLMSTLFNSLLFAPNSNHWAITRPILSLLLLDNGAFVDYQRQLGATQTQENQQKLGEEFARLTEGLQRSLEVTNRDRFTQRLTIFRVNTRNFLAL